MRTFEIKVGDEVINYELPKQDAEKYIHNGFYVTMNNCYTATVRNLESFISAINSCGIDETFGDVVKWSTDENIGNFKHYMMDIICKVKGFKMFNSYRHSFVQLDDENQTVSIKTKDGKHITVSVIGSAGCVDVAYHDAPIKSHNGSKDIPAFKVIGFDCGATPVKHTNVTLFTMLTAEHYYESDLKGRSGDPK